MIVGFFPMCADLLHAGHVLALEEAKKNCDYLIVGLNVLPYGKDPVQSVYERYIQLKAVKYVDEVIPYEGSADMINVVRSLKYDVRFMGSDYEGRAWDGQDHEKCDYYFIDRRHGFSTTELVERIRRKS